MVSLGVISAHAANVVYTFDNFDSSSNNDAYTDASNWDQGSVPNLSLPETALLSSDNGTTLTSDAVTYTPSADLVISNGGILEVSSGSFTQVTGNNYIQLGQQGQGTGTGNGTILVNGGTFNQGTDSANPFNITGTGNAFTITSGAANFNGAVGFGTGITYTQSGGTVTLNNNGEFDFNNTTGTLSGGALNARLITGVNATGSARFTLSGGMLNLGTTSDSTFIYGGGTTQYVNFTLNSTASIHLNNASATISQADGFINSSAIEYNNTANSPLADFSVTQNSTTGFVTIALAPGLIPEPSSIWLMALGIVGLAGWKYRKRRVSIV